MKLKYTQNLGIYNYFWSPLSVTKMEAEFKQDKQKRELFNHKSGALVRVLFRAHMDPEPQMISLQLVSLSMPWAGSLQAWVKGLSTVQLLTPRTLQSQRETETSPCGLGLGGTKSELRGMEKGHFLKQSSVLLPGEESICCTGKHKRCTLKRSELIMFQLFSVSEACLECSIFLSPKILEIFNFLVPFVTNA